MNMDIRNLNNTLALVGLCLCFAILTNAEIDSSCPGPKRLYEEIGCTPVFHTRGATCPKSYNCDHLNILPPEDKCFYNGHSYEIGEKLREEDKIWCGIRCTCSEIEPYGFGDTQVRFVCYAGKCPERNQTACGAMLLHPDEVRQFCAPHYAHGRSPQTDCYESFRCGHPTNIVIEESFESNLITSEPADPAMQCKFGKLIMNVGDEFHEEARYESDCVRCVCEVPPIVTCRSTAQPCPVSQRNRPYRALGLGL